MDYTVHEILHARTLVWETFASSWGYSQPRDQTQVSHIAGILYQLSHEGSNLPFRYDLNQIPYDYTVQVTNRFKGLDVIECLKNYGQMFVTLYRR